MVYALLACISVAMMSPIESFADIKGERFWFHLQGTGPGNSEQEIRFELFHWDKY